MPVIHRFACRVGLVAVVLLVAAACASTDRSTSTVEIPVASTAIVAPTILEPSPPLATARPTVESTPNPTPAPTPEPTPAPVVTGLGQLVASDFELLAGKRVGVIANATSAHDGRHIIDLLAAAADVELVAAFAPEHGIRGIADAGASVNDETDPLTGIPIFSLYGANRAPTAASLAGIDVVVYDLQDVGVRYYTYISTLGLAMQAAAQAGVAFVVLDRPNPLGDRIAGFVRDDGLESFVSQYPVPSAYGLTVGELATAIVGEAWLPQLADLNLTIVPMANWEPAMGWEQTGLDWIAPSPGLPSLASARSYPATVLFEATTLSYGKGTEAPFQQIGATWLDGPRLAADLNALGLPGVAFEPVGFTPSAELAPNVRLAGQQLSGVELAVTSAAGFDPVAAGVHLLATVERHAAEAGQASIIDRPDFFDLLAGSTQVREGIIGSVPAEQIIAAWSGDTEGFLAVHERYRRY